jgi:hypothetical protein
VKYFNRKQFNYQELRGSFSAELLCIIIMEFLISMGFPENQCQNALRTSNGNVDQAIELLLSNSVPSDVSSSRSYIRCFS